ncbi:MAG: ATP-binding protein [Cytophagaceae bacterium]|jgi:NadR type nicotinamide-nucleotide adenylyltransferase|nr:ATP-binding protein [Cytophagaceae bacterium]
MLKRIVLYGPESTGKSTLAESLAHAFESVYVPEFARGYLDFKREVYDPFGRQSSEICQPQDIPSIVIGQIVMEEAFALQANRFLFCDTNPLQTLVYNRYYFKRSEEWIEKIIQERVYDYYLLTDIDIPWIEDPLRDRPKPEDRKILFDLFHSTLLQYQLPFDIISGDQQKRLEKATTIINQLELK